MKMKKHNEKTAKTTSSWKGIKNFLFKIHTFTLRHAWLDSFIRASIGFWLPILTFFMWFIVVITILYFLIKGALIGYIFMGLYIGLGCATFALRWHKTYKNTKELHEVRNYIVELIKANKWKKERFLPFINIAVDAYFHGKRHTAAEKEALKIEFFVLASEAESKNATD